MVALATLLTLGASIAWISQREPQYEATAEILVTPLSQGEDAFLGLQLLRDSGEPTRTVQTAAALVETVAAAELTAERLGPGWTSTRVRNAVAVEPRGESNILGVTATTGDAEESAEVANTFARASLDARQATLRREVAAMIDRLQVQERRLGQGTPEAAATLAERLAALEGVRDGNDPTLSITERATPRDSPLGAPPFIVVALALVAGFTLGMATAVALELTERRIRDEDELLSIYPLPVLARVPLAPRRSRAAVGTGTMPPAIREAYRTLQVQLEARGGSRRSVMVTSASSSDGKTTSAINLAFSLVAGGHRVILIDFDLRKPDLARRLGIDPGDRSLVSLIASKATLSELLTPAPQVPLLRVVTATSTEGDVALLEALIRRLPVVLAEATELADYVILDTAPLGEVSDALKIADQVDDVVVVVRPGHTNRVNLEQTRDLLAGLGRKPTGLVLIGEKPGGSSTYYTYGNRPDSGERRALSQTAS